MGVDHEREMLSMFAQNAEKREISCQVFEGFWPEIADQVPMADVVLCHHVLYNISEIGPFLLGLDSHARSRVVVEMSTCHPLSHHSGAWKHCWNIDRPTTPTSEDVLEFLKEIGIKAEIHYWSGKLRDQIDIDQENDFIRVRLCLPPERLSEVRDYFLDNPSPMHRELATIWWDISA